MATQFILSGIVQDKGTKGRLIGATVKMVTPNSTLLVETNQNGNFTFPAVNEPDLKDGEDKYTIEVFVFAANSRQETTPESIEVKKGTTSHFTEIQMVDRGPISNGVGIGFLIALLVLLSGLAYFYYFQHNKTVNKNKDPIDYKMVDFLIESMSNRITSDSIKVSGFQLVDNKIDSIDSLNIIEDVDQLKESAEDLFDVAHTDSSYREVINRNLDDVNEAIVNNSKEQIQAAFLRVKSNVDNIPSLRPSWFWTEIPGVYFEILFWALFATLLRLIGNTSYYISRNNFYQDSVYHKMALLFTIPLIALLIAFVVSFFKISIAIGGTEFVVDFSNPYISIILASLIGLAPWKAWEFMYGLADLLFKSLKKWLGLNKSGDTKSEGEESNTNQNEPKDSEAPLSPDEQQTDTELQGAEESSDVTESEKDGQAEIENNASQPEKPKQDAAS